MKIYFIRHGKTEWNLESRYQGAGGDSPLLPNSYREMKQLANFLKAIPFKRIYASPIKRARITAFQVNAGLNHSAPISLWNRLEEFHLGKMEGKQFTEVKEKYPEEYDDFINHPDKYEGHEIGGETYQDVIDRMIPAVKTIAQTTEADANVMIVSHGAALNALINSLLGTSIADTRKRGGLTNTSTTIVETNDHGKSFQLLKWNDTEYLTRKIDSTDTI